MARWYGTGVVALGLGLAQWMVASPAWAQNIDRETTITGPKGNTLTRSVDINRGPGGVTRDITVHRPGGATLQRDTVISRAPGGFGGRGFVPGGGFGRWGPGPRGPVFFGGGPVIVGGGGGGISPLGAGLLGGALGTGVGMLMGSAISSNNQPPPPPQTVVVARSPARWSRRSHRLFSMYSRRSRLSPSIRCRRKSPGSRAISRELARTPWRSSGECATRAPSRR